MDGADEPDAAAVVDAAQPGTEVAASTSGRPAEEQQKKAEKSALRRCASYDQTALMYMTAMRCVERHCISFGADLRAEQ